MDYLEIVLKGYLKDNIKEHLDNYFFREFKKAEKENYGVHEFFEGCLGITKEFTSDLQRKVSEELNKAESALKNSSSKIEATHIKHNISEVNEHKFYVHLHSLTQGSYTRNLSYNEVLLIEKSIREAYTKSISDRRSALLARLKNLEENPEGKEKIDSKLNETQPQNLIDLFNKVSDYKSVMKILSTQGFIDGCSEQWIDAKKGGKGILVAILKELKNKGYYKKKLKIVNQTYQDIALNTFGKEVSMETIKKANSNNNTIPNIPYPSTLT